MSVIVLDASAAVEIALWSTRGEQLAPYVADAEVVHVPSHFLLECANALRRMEARGALVTSDAEACLESIRALRTLTTEATDLLAEAWAMRQTVTILDGVYVALARRHGAVLVTGDVRLARAPKPTIDVVFPAAEHIRENPSAEEIQSLQFASDVYLQGMWARVLPPGAVLLISELVRDGPGTRAALDRRLGSHRRRGDGLRELAWEPPHLWTDAELARLDEEFGPDEHQPSSAREAILEESRELAERVVEFDRLSSLLQVQPVRTLAELLDFMLAIRLLTERVDGTIWIDPLAPLPDEVLDLTEDEQVLQSRLRWHAIFEQIGFRIIARFQPGSAERIESLSTSLRELGADVDAETESVRAALLGLLEDGDFTTITDVSRISADETFRLDVDWDLFARSRIGVEGDSGP